MSAIGLSFKTKISFDKAKIMAAVEKGEKTALMRGGGLIRIIAKRMIRKRKAASKPGDPPSSHRGTLRDLMEFSFDSNTGTVVVGPKLFLQAAQKHVPNTLEFGGAASSYDRRRVRRIGDGGEIRVSGGRFAGKGRGKTTKSFGNIGGGTVLVTYTKIRTAAQAARATAINSELVTPKSKNPSIAPRPFMGPALKIATPSLPDYWRNSVVA